MAMSFNENLDDNGEMHEINVTPFIDVMLVLLIIFMVAAPLATVDVKVNLPASSSQSFASKAMCCASLSLFPCIVKLQVWCRGIYLVPFASE